MDIFVANALISLYLYNREKCNIINGGIIGKKLS